MNVDTAKLRELIAKATPGPWACHEHGVGEVVVHSVRRSAEEEIAVAFVDGRNAAYIAAANPAAVAAILAERDALERNRDMWRGQCERQGKQLEATRWRPIQTAPHGQEVLLGWTDRDGAWINEVGMASWGWRTEVGNNMSSHGRATHWMPLPPAPAALATQTEQRQA